MSIRVGLSGLYSCIYWVSRPSFRSLFSDLKGVTAIIKRTSIPEAVFASRAVDMCSRCPSGGTSPSYTKSKVLLRAEEGSRWFFSWLWIMDTWYYIVTVSPRSQTKTCRKWAIRDTAYAGCRRSGMLKIGRGPSAIAGKVGAIFFVWVVCMLM